MSLFIGDFDFLQRNKNNKSRQLERLLAECRREMDGPHYTEHPAMSITFMALYMINQALSYRLTGEKIYFDEAVRWMDTVTSFEHWGNDQKMEDVDLSASWVLFGLCLSYDWLSDVIDEERKGKYEEKIIHHAHIFYFYWRSTRGHGWATEYWQNHNWINMTGLASAGYLMKDKCEEAALWIESTEGNFDKVFSYLADDGSNYEGVSYWRYGGMWLFIYAYLRRNEEGTDFFKSSEYLKNTFYYRLYQSSPDLHMQLDFGDAHDRHSCHAACVYYLCASEYRDGHAQKLGNLVTQEILEEEWVNSGVHPGILPEAGLEYIWYDPEVKEEDFADLSLCRFFPDLGLISIRSGWSEDAKVFSFRSGCPGGRKQWMNGWQINRENGWRSMSLSHNHPDNLSYILVNGSNYFTREDGYDRNIMPYCHNAILADGKTVDVEGVSDSYLASVYKRMGEDPAFIPDESYIGRISYYLSTDEFILFEGESGGTYASSLSIKRASRMVFTIPSLDFIVMIDEIESDKMHTFSILCNTDEKPEQDGTSFKYPLSRVSYSVFSDSALYHEMKRHEIRSIMTWQEPDKFTHVEINSLESTLRDKSFKACFYEFFDLSEGRYSFINEKNGIRISDGEDVYILNLSDEYVTLNHMGKSLTLARGK